MTNKDALDELKYSIRYKVEEWEVPVIDIAIKGLKAIDRMCAVSKQYDEYKINGAEEHRLLLEILKEVE